jgi:hypothetical protein
MNSAPPQLIQTIREFERRFSLVLLDAGTLFMNSSDLDLCLALSQSTIRSTKRAILYDFGGFRRSQLACKSLKILILHDCHDRS